MKSEQSSDNEIEFLDRQTATKNIPTKFNSKNGHRNHLYSQNKIKHLKIMQKIFLLFHQLHIPININLIQSKIMHPLIQL